MGERHRSGQEGGGTRRVRACNSRGLFVGVLASASFFVYFIYSSLVITHTDYAQIRPRLPQSRFQASSASSHNSTDVTQSGSANSADVTQSATNVISATTVPPVAAHNVTVVTAFLDIGEFGKGTPGNKRDWHIYQKWSSAYSQLQAPVVMYTNSDRFADFFASVRHRQQLRNLTKVVRVREADIWAFSLKPQIAAIYAAGYPRHWPNTVYPAYTCVTHAKFDFLRDTIEKGYFPSRLVAWMDIGYLRNIAGGKATNRYVMYPPSGFDPRRVLCGEVFSPNFNLPWRSILRRNQNWVAGGFFLATQDVMTSFVQQYRKAVLAFLRRRESQVEQHILYATYTREGRAIVHPTVELQAQHGDWFDVGFSCLHLLSTPTTLPPPETPRPTTTTTQKRQTDGNNLAAPGRTPA